MNNDTRCCGIGTCIVNREGRCWCGQQWDGQKMYRPALSHPPVPETPPTKDDE